MDIELVETLRLIIERYRGRTQGSVFIPLKDFPWHNKGNNQLTKLHNEGMISKPRYFDNGAEITITKAGRDFFKGVLFPSSGSPITCPICGMRAKIIQTDAARSWAEISCENCSTYAIRKDALLGIAVTDFPLLSGYYRHAWHEPMTIQCDSQDTVEEHVMETRQKVTRDYQIKMLLSHYYQQMNHFGEQINFEGHPAIAYATDMEDLNQIICEAVERNFVVFENGTITVTKQGKEWIDAKESGDIGKVRDEIFISHRTTDSTIADMIKDFLVNTGIPNDKIFCSSLPGNDVGEKIAPEVKAHLKKATIIILLLSRDYYASAYCLNEAGIAWYLDEVLSIPIGLPEIEHTNMFGFLGSDYKLRRLSDDGDIAYLFDQAQGRLRTGHVAHSIITQETRKLKERYKKYISERKVDVSTEASDKVAMLEAENAKLRKIIEKNDLHDVDDDTIDYDDDIWEDGYHEVKNGDGDVLKKGQFANGKLIDGIEYNIVLRVAKGEEDKEEPVHPDELKDEKWHYREYGQYEGVFGLMIGRDEIVDTGLQFFYVVDKKVTTEGKRVRPTFTNFRTLESFLAEKEPDELDYIKTGVRKYEQTDCADIEIN